MPLEAPPTESFDMLNVQVCPGCGGTDAIVQEVEDAQVAKCPHCQCEFPPRMESVTRKVIRRISEHRQRRLRRLAERLPLNPPVAGLDPTDYTLFRKIADGPNWATMRLSSTRPGVPSGDRPMLEPQEYAHKQIPPHMRPTT